MLCQISRPLGNRSMIGYLPRFSNACTTPNPICGRKAVSSSLRTSNIALIVCNWLDPIFSQNQNLTLLTLNIHPCTTGPALTGLKQSEAYKFEPNLQVQTILGLFLLSWSDQSYTWNPDKTISRNDRRSRPTYLEDNRGLGIRNHCSSS